MTRRPCAICAYPSPYKCSGCEQAHYCSKEHQQIGWEKHKGLCKIYREAAKPGGSMPNPNTYCGLCGGKGRLTKTLCCGQTICDDYGKYQPFSFSGASCARNHQRYTLCAAHSNEPGCSGSWKKCQKCKDRHAHLLENYVWYGTNSYNFLSETLRNPPEFQPSLCLGCKKKIVLQTEPHSLEPGGVRCSACMMRKMGGRVKPENVYTMDAT